MKYYPRNPYVVNVQLAYLPMGVTQAPVGLILVHQATCILSYKQILFMTFDALFKVTELFITLSEITKRPCLV